MSAVSSCQNGSCCERSGDRLGAGHDQSVDLQAAEIGDIGILSVDHAAWPAATA